MKQCPLYILSKLNRRLSVGGFLLSTFLLLGAGCSSQPSSPTSDIYSSQTSPTSPTSQTSPIPMTTPSSLAFPGILPPAEIRHKQIHLSTTKGEIVFDLFDDTAPKTVSNFVYLTNQGFYNGLTFHRVEKTPSPFVIQGGDPKGNGTGGPGYKFEDELKDSRTYTRGIVAMANAGSNTNGSQFFIMLADTPLSKDYTIFGNVVSGMEVVDKIQVGDKMTKVTVEDKK